MNEVITRKIDYFKQNLKYCLIIALFWLITFALSVVVPLILFCRKFGFMEQPVGTRILLAGKFAILIIIFCLWHWLNKLIAGVHSGALRAVLQTLKTSVVLYLCYSIMKVISVNIDSLASLMLVAVVLNVCSVAPRICMEEFIRRKNGEDNSHDMEIAAMAREERLALRAEKKAAKEKNKPPKSNGGGKADSDGEVFIE